jgi:hypothetical protein
LGFDYKKDRKLIQCLQCGRPLNVEGGPGPVASICGGILGDEYTDSYYFCPNCGLYTVEVHYDRFLGEGESSLRGPLSKPEGDENVRLIGECAEPWDKKCRCPAHRSYFGDSLD